MRPSATTVARLAVISGVVITGLSVWASLSLPALDVRLSAVDGRVEATGLGGAGPVVVTAIRSSAGEMSLEPIDLIDEPDVVATWAEMDRFFDRQARLSEVLSGAHLELRGASGWLPSRRTSRTPGSVHWTFYAQVLAALVAWLAGLVTYAFSDRKAGARAYAISAVGIAVALWPAAIYSTRALALDGTSFRLLSAVDHLGGFFYCAGLIALFCCYPTVLIERRAWIWASAPLAFVLDQLHVLPKAYGDFYSLCTIYLLALLVVAPWQWLRSRPDPVARAAFGWILFASLLGMAGFVLAILLPVVLGLPTLASQGVALPLYATTYAAVSLGVLQVRLFELDRWWFRAWSWLLGGALVFAGDLVLMSTFDLESRESLLVTLALAGWLYFPVRQWVWSALLRRDRRVDATEIADLLTARDTRELDARFEVAAQTLFSPLRIETRPEKIEDPELDSRGTSLRLPKPTSGHLVCHYRNGGRNLFRRRDLDEARRLVVVGRSVARALRAYEQGEEQERQRIRRDLHDDMGASIIRIIHGAPDPATATLAKRAMRDLRNVLLALSPESASVAETLADVRAELAPMVERAGPMTWEVEGEATWELSSRQRANLVRTLREATTNALRHGDGGTAYRYVLSDDGIDAEIRNAAFEPSGDEGTGFGLSNIAVRIEELGGTVALDSTSGEFRLVLHLPREEP